MADYEYLDPLPAPTALKGPPARGRVLLVAPHPDDELIGPGGTALLHRSLGDPVFVTVLTDGTTGDVRSKHDAATYRKIREEESRVACARLGVQEVEFCGFPDGARAREDDLGVVVPRLSEMLERWQIDVVYAPHFGEVHGDHFVTAVAVRRAVDACHRPIRTFGYEIWAPLVARWVVDVSAVMEEKRAIVHLYESQVAHTDIVHFFTGLNAYRGVYLPKGSRYGEAFDELEPRRP